MLKADGGLAGVESSAAAGRGGGREGGKEGGCGVSEVPWPC